ncbi:MAG: RimK family protein [Burkholderiaceae bacterium]
MKQTLLLADELGDLEVLGGPYQMATTRDYVARPAAFGQKGMRIINLSRGYGYQSLGYYVSLLAEARGHKVIPSVETSLDLASREGYARALPELEAAFARDLSRTDAGAQFPDDLYIYLGEADDRRFSAFARLLFDWFRAPVISVNLARHQHRNQRAGDGPVSIGRIQVRSFTRLLPAHKQRFADVLAAQSKGVWRSPKARSAARYSLAVLYDPDETLPPSSQATLKHFARVAERLSMEVEPIRRRDLARLAEHDALFIRETTSIRNHTYRFAQRALAEGMPVIDDAVSMIRCTNKVYLWERLNQAGLPSPQTVVLRRQAQLAEVADSLGFPLVLKVPDGSFSRGVKRADDMDSLQRLAKTFFADSELLLAQKFMPTRFDWRIGVLGGEPLFACQYLMARNHWQIVDHKADGRAIEGGFKTFELADAPPEVIDIGVRAARLIGDGFYGVDLKESPDGIVVIEINDNPNLEHGVEDQVGRDIVWSRLAQWFIDRLRR